MRGYDQLWTDSHLKIGRSCEYGWDASVGRARGLVEMDRNVVGIEFLCTVPRD